MTGFKLQLTAFFCLALTSVTFGGMNIFGTDNRQAITSTAYPWSTIGRLSNGCSGTLVGKNVVVTAAHCAIVTGTNNLVSGLTFYPNYIDFDYRHSSRVVRARFGNTNGVGLGDWAVLKLEDDLGDTYGWMGVKGSFSGSYVNNAGYSADFRSGGTGSVHIDCQLRGTNAWGMWTHDCDMTRGASGGPLFTASNDVVAVNSGENRLGGEESLVIHGGYDPNYANVAVPAAQFVNAVIRVKNDDWD